MRSIPCLFVCLFCTLSMASAQVALSGKLIGASDTGVAGASLFLFKQADSALVKTAVSDARGLFQIEDITAGAYYLRVNSEGYTVFYTESLHMVAATDLGVLKLTQSRELENVTVRAQKPLIEIHADKLVVNVANSIVNTGSNALEVLGRSPGVMVDQSENIRMKGKPAVTVMIDGKPAPVQGADLASLLKNMPTANIEKIELITNPGARYDAAGSGGIINIITKRDRNAGWNGSVNANYGQGVYHKVSGGFNASYHKKKWTINTSYNYSNRAGFNKLAINRYFYDGSGNTRVAYSQDGATIYPAQSHNAMVAADYALSAKTTIGVAVKGDITHFNPMGDNYSRVDSGNTYTFFSTSNRSNDEWYNYAVNGYLRHNFDSTGRSLAIDVDYARFWNQTYQRYTNKYYGKEGDSMMSDYLLFGDLHGLTQIRSAKIDYEQNIFAGIKLTLGTKFSLVTADNSLFYYDQTNGGNLLDSSKSNHFIYREHINAGYLNLAKEGKQWSWQFGLRGEQTIAEGDQRTTHIRFERNYFQLFPSMAVQRHINKNNDLGLTLSRRIDRPNYRQLNPFRYFLDPTNSKIGNPYLLPSLTYAAELSHVYKQRFVTSVSYSVGKDIIIETLEADTARENTSINSDKNLDRQYYYGLSGSYAPSVTKWWTLTVNFNAYYTRFQGNLSNTPLNDGQLTANINMMNSLVLPWDMTGEVSGFYQTPQRWGYYTFKAMYGLNFGLQKSLLNRKLTVKTSVNDVFRSSAPTAEMHFSNFTEYFVATRDTRVFMLSLTWRFGTNQQSRRHRGGAEDEIRRASGNG